MVKHIKKNYAKDGKLTDKEKSIAYATAWKHHNEETEHTTHAKDVVKVDKDKLKATKSIKKDLDKVTTRLESKKNTLVFANTHAVHRRGDGNINSVRDSIHFYSRENPFKK